MSRRADTYLSLPYPILLFPPEPPDTTWFVKIPLLPGCMSDGETVEGALANLKEAQRLWLEVALEHGRAIQEPETRMASERGRLLM
jgi:predicted RNase H-like HicB family nuclease